MASEPYGHILTNTAVGSPDSSWIVYYIRSDPAGSIFDGTRIERVNVVTHDVEVPHESGQGAVQLWTISPNRGQPRQVATSPFDVASAFSRRPEVTRVAFAANGSIFIASADSGQATRLTAKVKDRQLSLRSESCASSPDGQMIAYARPVKQGRTVYNQVLSSPAT